MKRTCWDTGWDWGADVFVRETGLMSGGRTIEVSTLKADDAEEFFVVAMEPSVSPDKVVCVGAADTTLELAETVYGRDDAAVLHSFFVAVVQTIVLKGGTC